ncbi:MAG TPA: SAM-dependent methyltransferase [Streptosporangiaceae bacterium]
MQPDGFADIDTKTASAARMYDYMLGGTDNYAVDRIAVNRVEDLLPGTNAMVRNNRRFLERVVRYLAADCGIRQFMDNGSGLPTQNNVHDIARSFAAGSRVVYVDNDPVVLRHQQVQALEGNADTAFILADARDVDAILDHQETKRLLDFAEPTAVLYFAFLHFIPDEDNPQQMIRRLIDRLAPGSYLALSHTVSNQSEIRQLGTELARDNTKGRFGRIREVGEVREFFDGLELVEPGLVDIRDWRPDGRDEKQTDRWFLAGGVGRKPSEGAG